MKRIRSCLGAIIIVCLIICAETMGLATEKAQPLRYSYTSSKADTVCISEAVLSPFFNDNAETFDIRIRARGASDGFMASRSLLPERLDSGLDGNDIEKVNARSFILFLNQLYFYNLQDDDSIPDIQLKRFSIDVYQIIDHEGNQRIIEIDFYRGSNVIQVSVTNWMIATESMDESKPILSGFFKVDPEDYKKLEDITMLLDDPVDIQ